MGTASPVPHWTDSREMAGEVAGCEKGMPRHKQDEPLQGLAIDRVRNSSLSYKQHAKKLSSLPAMKCTYSMLHIFPKISIAIL
jgi:hypothetical protein